MKHIYSNTIQKHLRLYGKGQCYIKTFSKGLSFNNLVKGLFAQKAVEGRL